MVILVSYDLKQPGRDYAPVFAYLRQFTHCKRMESLWLLDTKVGCGTIRDGLKQHVDSNDVLFVVQLQEHWGSFNYGCAEWLKDPSRSW